MAPASNANSSPGTVNLKEPQSKQTKDFAITKTPGLERCFRPEKWNIISALNSASLADLHNTQDMTTSQPGNLATKGTSVCTKLNTYHYGPMRFWQRRFYDFNVYSRGRVKEKLNYMHASPLARKLVKHPREWPIHKGCGTPLGLKGVPPAFLWCWPTFTHVALETHGARE